MRDLYIQVDDLEEITILYPRTIEADLDAGHHRLKITNRLFTKSVDFEVAEGVDAVFRVANVSAGCLFAPLIVLGGTGAYRVHYERLE